MSSLTLVVHHDSSLKLSSITEAQAQDLSHACSPATFGLNNQDVLDESYRKAGKLDVGKFAWLFSPASRSDFTVQLISGTKLPWSTILSLIEEGSFRLRKGQDARSPRFVYDRFIFESITETLDDTIGILFRKSFTAFVVRG